MKEVVGIFGGSPAVITLGILKNPRSPGKPSIFCCWHILGDRLIPLVPLS